MWHEFDAKEQEVISKRSIGVFLLTGVISFTTGCGGSEVDEAGTLTGAPGQLTRARDDTFSSPSLPFVIPIETGLLGNDLLAQGDDTALSVTIPARTDQGGTLSVTSLAKSQSELRPIVVVNPGGSYTYTPDHRIDNTFVVTVSDDSLNQSHLHSFDYLLNADGHRSTATVTVDIGPQVSATPAGLQLPTPLR